MAAANRLWGAERIRGELLKLGVRVAKTTVQRHMRNARPPRRAGQTWATFLRNHAPDMWACAFFVIALGWRRIVHVGVTRYPTDAWVAQKLREATRSASGLGTSAATMTASTVPRSLGSPKSAASRNCGRPIAPPRQRPARVPRPHTGPGRGVPAARAARIRGLLQSAPAPAGRAPAGPRRPNGSETGTSARSQSSAACTVPTSEPRETPG